MDQNSRRGALGGLAAMAAAPAIGQVPFPPPAILRHPGFAGWAPGDGKRAPLDAGITYENGRASTIGRWMAGRPTLLILWALWCAPCLEEKPSQDALLRRLRAAGSRVQILALQTYDHEPLSAGRDRLDRLRVRALPIARASAEAEAQLVPMTGGQPGVAHSAIAMPAMALISADGREIGRHHSRMPPLAGKPTWFDTRAAYDLMMLVGKVG